jgi:hypothetical protein
MSVLAVTAVVLVFMAIAVAVVVATAVVAGAVAAVVLVFVTAAPLLLAMPVSVLASAAIPSGHPQLLPALKSVAEIGYFSAYEDWNLRSSVCYHVISDM